MQEYVRGATSVRIVASLRKNAWRCLRMCKRWLQVKNGLVKAKYGTIIISYDLENIFLLMQKYNFIILILYLIPKCMKLYGIYFPSLQQYSTTHFHFAYQLLPHNLFHYYCYNHIATILYLCFSFLLLFSNFSLILSCYFHIISHFHICLIPLNSESSSKWIWVEVQIEFSSNLLMKVSHHYDFMPLWNTCYLVWEDIIHISLFGKVIIDSTVLLIFVF